MTQVTEMIKKLTCLAENLCKGRENQPENQKVSWLNHTLNEQPLEGRLKPTFYETIISQST